MTFHSSDKDFPWVPLPEPAYPEKNMTRLFKIFGMFIEGSFILQWQDEIGAIIDVLPILNFYNSAIIDYREFEME
jgi:hypothetical protein